MPALAISMKQVAAMALSEKNTKGLIVEKCASITVNNILPDDDVNEEFSEIDGNITGVEWEAEPPEAELQRAAFHILHIQNN